MTDAGDVEVLFNQWLKKTVAYHRVAISRLKVQDTEALDRSIRSELRRLGTGYLQGTISFLEHGRFQDMGSGRGYSFGQKTSRGQYDMDEPRKGRIQGRKPKKWYGKVLYGRLNDLQGAIGYQLMEQAIDTVKKELVKV